MELSAKEKELFEHKPVLQAIFSVALPSIIGQIILVIYNMADTFFVGLAHNDATLTAVTVCMPAFMFLSAISNLFGIGGSSLMSRMLGKGKTEKAKNASTFAVYGCLIVTFLYCLFALIFVDTFVDLLGGKDPAVHQQAVQYMLICVIGGGLFTSMNTLFSHLVRSQGKSLYASFGIVLGGILNVCLDPLFMFVILPKGQEAIGAAIATCLSNFIALFYYIILLIKGRKKYIISLKPTLSCLKDRIPLDVIIVGIPACAMTLCENISYAILDNLMYANGLAAQAGIGVAKKINMLAHSIVRGMTQGVLPLIGYNKAAKNYKRMKQVVYLSGGISLLISLICMTMCLFFGKELSSIFLSTESESIKYSETFLHILCVGAPFSAIAYTIISFFQAVGKGWRSLIVALLRKGILDIPLMYILQSLIPVSGIVFATPLADFICCIVGLILFIIYISKKKDPNEKIPEEYISV